MRAVARSRSAMAASLVLAALPFLALAAGASAQKSKTGTVLPGGNSNKPINIEAVKLDYFDKEQKLVYTGNVIATQGDSKLKASVLTIFLAPKGGGGSGSSSSSANQVQRMLATGPVALVQRDQIGTGDNGVYDRARNTVVLNGNVTLSQGPNVTKGDRLVYDLKSGQAAVTGRVKSMFLPGSNNPDAAATDDTSARKRPKGGSASAAGSRGM